ncbi:hypothetical protein MNVI_37640 [Mycobacterium noviomagense]|uniref:Transposase n=1 Tax=Mycobacterium noviomagense TaxID=459858 RepID=A0A7I7PIP4_9MYCO|nr:hypothetical protein BST37_04500 [Mycobacterium noviomagense]BBY08446.1 hypothetical protein MNVI_37640 [Mycobacterium noviomagense]
MLPDTDAIRPATWSVPLACAGAADELVGLADGLVALFPLFDVPHAATDNAVAATAANITNRASAVGKGKDIGVLRSLRKRMAATDLRGGGALHDRRFG